MKTHRRQGMWKCSLQYRFNCSSFNSVFPNITDKYTFWDILPRTKPRDLQRHYKIKIKPSAQHSWRGIKGWRDVWTKMSTLPWYPEHAKEITKHWKKEDSLTSFQTRIITVIGTWFLKLPGEKEKQDTKIWSIERTTDLMRAVLSSKQIVHRYPHNALDGDKSTLPQPWDVCVLEIYANKLLISS